MKSERVILPSGDCNALPCVGGGADVELGVGDVDEQPAEGDLAANSIDGKLYAFFGSGAPASGYSRWPMFRGNAVRSGRVAPAPDGGRLVNLATRAQAGNGTPLIAGLVTKGAGAKNYLIRAVGPTLEQFGVQNPLRDPTLAVPGTSSAGRARRAPWRAI